MGGNMPRGVFEHKQKSHCKHGHELTPENSYQTFKNGKKNGRACIQCAHVLHKDYRRRNPEVMQRSRRKSQDGLRYGRDYDRDAQLASQGGACAICGITGLKWGKGFNNVWHTDHVHGKEGTHRGVLCATCNTALGRLEPFMDKVIAYLAKYAVEQGTEKST
jgi:hypothetical protein